MLGLILILVYLLVSSASLAILFKEKIEHTLATTIFFTIIFFYIMALFGKLKYGLVICFIFFIIMLINLIYRFIFKKDSSHLKYLITGGLVIFLMFFVINWIMSSHRLLSAWDEFSHWGLVSKNMYYLDVLGSSNKATTNFKGYPPAIALFQYFWNKLYGGFAEGNLFRATNIFSFSLILPMISKSSKQISTYLLNSLILLILPLSFFDSFYSTVYVDAILGILFAYILFSYYTSDFSNLNLLNIFLASAILILTKASGMGLVLIAFLIIFTDQLIFSNMPIKKKIKKLSTYFLVIILTNQSWKFHLKYHDSTAAWNTSKVTLGNLLKIKKGEGEPYQYEVLENFIHKIFGEVFNTHFFNITIFSWLILAICLAVLVSNLLKRQDDAKRYNFAFIGVITGAVIYSISMLVLYLFTYSEYEAIRLASISRYLNTYLLAMFLFLLSILCYCIGNKKIVINPTKHSFYILLILLLLTNTDAVASYSFLNNIKINQTISTREPYTDLEKVKHTIEKNEAKNKPERLYFIAQGDKGYDYWVARYTLTPYFINSNMTWSIGEKSNEEDIWTKEKSLKDWKQELVEEYTYVYIYKTNESFAERFNSLFENKEVEARALYRVNKSEGAQQHILEKVELFP